MSVITKFSKITLPILTTTLILTGTIFTNKTIAAENLSYKLTNEEKNEIKKVKSFKLPNNLGLLKSEVKKNSKSKYKKAQEIVSQYYIDRGIIVSNDIDDVDYQNQVKSLGGAADVFGENTEIIVEFVKFIDLYENYQTNQKISELMTKVNENKISEDEVRELLNYAPIQSTDTKTLNIPSTESNFTTFATTFPNGYNPTAARDYALLWTDNTIILRNNSEYSYYSNTTGTFYEGWNDCTNYVSQALRAGGFAYRGGSLTNGYTYDTAWFYTPTKPSHTWGGAYNFYRHWKVRAGVTASAANLGTADVVNADFTKDGDIEHTAIVTRNASTSAYGKWLSQHTPDREETTTVGTWYDLGYDVYGYEMDKATN